MSPATAAPDIPILRPIVFAVLLGTLAATLVALQVVRDRLPPPAAPAERVLYVPSGAVLDRLALSFDALLADVYWIRAIQHYGGTKRAVGGDKRYALLYPLLDITTTLDPRFNIAYRFGAIFLTEAYPNGPGRPDQAVALLEKGFRRNPKKWQYLQDIGFIHYWWLHDYVTAAAWFKKASEVPGSSWWLKSLAATTLTQGGDRQSSRMLWHQIYQTADNDWLKRDAQRRLAQLAALDDLDRLLSLVERYHARTGRWPDRWERLVELGLLLRVPVDPAGVPYVLDLSAGTISLSKESSLYPLPVEPPAVQPPS